MKAEGPETEEALPRRFTVDLFITHPTLDPTEITAALGWEAHFSYRAGDARRTPVGNPLPGIEQSTRWRHQIRHEVRNQWFAERVDDFLNHLANHKAFLGTIRSTGGTACVIVQFLGDGYFGDELRRDTLVKLIDLDLDFAIECFATPQS